MCNWALLSSPEVPANDLVLIYTLKKLQLFVCRFINEQK